MKLKALEDATSQCQRAATLFKSQLTPKKRRPITTASVARRMIANSLNIRIDVSEQQRKKESKKLSDAKSNFIKFF